ncbi:MarR family winged helix-turn-helix transcriptional regulator [Gorillibacterium sp. sgz5001074]|uniref:MarR family winged helix-turn-helix transcriptional regulator n=1 Tax=Gorillibacterium sp. sgz5001074 TaxID=3446695 RepID=UPI003F67AE2B
MEPEKSNIGYLLNKAALRLKWKLSSRLEQHGITIAQWSVLRDLAYQAQMTPGERRNTPAQIAARLEMDRPTLSGILERMSKKQWVRISTHPQDRRSQLVELTEEAEALISPLMRESEETLRLALQRMEDDEINRLRATLAKLIHNLDEGE